MAQGTAVSILQLPAGFGRWDEVLSLIMRAFAFMDGVIDPPSSAHRLTVESLADKARRETVLAAVKDGKIVGCAFVLERADNVYVGKLAVEPDLQGRGIGGRMMQAVETLARQRGKPAIELQTRVELIGNHEAFARLGFRETLRTMHEGYTRPTSLTMRKALA